MLKRAFDIIVAVLALTALIIPLIVIAFGIRIAIGRPIFFRQQRPGRNGIPFTMLKFRTMSDARDVDGRLLEDSKRLTRLGIFLRATSVDELPELWNVLKGEMSLVGPRPLLLEYLPLYSPLQARRHEVRPGITGWAQVNGRNAISWEEKFKLDVWYVDHRSFWLDIKILWLTVKKVLMRNDINAPGDSIMPVFKGSDDR